MVMKYNTDLTQSIGNDQPYGPLPAPVSSPAFRWSSGDRFVPPFTIRC